MNPKIETNILTPRRLMTRQDGQEVLDLLCNVSPNLVPEKWGRCEPIRTPFDPSDYSGVLEKWGKVFLWKRKRPRTEGRVGSAWSIRHKTGNISVTMDAAKAEVNALSAFVKESSSRFTAHFAYIHLLTEGDVRMGRLNHTVGLLDPGRQIYSLYITGYELARYLPDMYWVTVFGKPYVELFGLERLLASPAPILREIGGGCVLIQLSESIYDLETDFDAVDSVRQAVKKHLNCNAFFDPNLPEDHVYNVPLLELEPLPDTGD